MDEITATLLVIVFFYSPVGIPRPKVAAPPAASASACPASWSGPPPAGVCGKKGRKGGRFRKDGKGQWVKELRDVTPETQGRSGSRNRWGDRG